MKHFWRQLKKELKKHSFDYLLLVTAGIFFLISLHLFQGERLLEFIMILVFTSFYILWGMYHHTIEDTLHLRSMIEYILIGFIVLFLIKILLLL